MVESTNPQAYGVDEASIATAAHEVVTRNRARDHGAPQVVVLPIRSKGYCRHRPFKSKTDGKDDQIEHFAEVRGAFRWKHSVPALQPRAHGQRSLGDHCDSTVSPWNQLPDIVVDATFDPTSQLYPLTQDVSTTVAAIPAPQLKNGRSVNCS